MVCLLIFKVKYFSEGAFVTFIAPAADVLIPEIFKQDANSHLIITDLTLRAPQINTRLDSRGSAGTLPVAQWAVKLAAMCVSLWRHPV